MSEHAEPTRGVVSKKCQALPTHAPSVPPLAQRALAMQRAAGNRAAGRELARWAKHPDEEKKGVMVPDSSAAAYLDGNPPQNA